MDSSMTPEKPDTPYKMKQILTPSSKPNSNPSTWEIKAGGSLRVEANLTTSETPFQRRKKYQF